MRLVFHLGHYWFAYQDWLIVSGYSEDVVEIMLELHLEDDRDPVMAWA